MSFIIVYTYGLLQWNKLVKWRLSLKTSWIIKYLHYICFAISLTVALIYLQFDLGFRGLWTTRIFIITTLVTGVSFILISNRTINNKVETIYFRIFSFIPVLIGGVLYVPFLSVVVILSLFEQLTEPVNKIYYEDNKLRIQSSFVGVLGPPRVDIFKKIIVFEKRLSRTDFNSYEFDSLKVQYDKDSTRVLIYGLAKDENKPRILRFKKVD